MATLRAAARKAEELIRQLSTTLARRGPYRFLIRDWYGVSDLELLVRSFEAECFRHQLRPVALPVDRLKRIVALAPHVDDEGIGAGGSLLIASHAGAQIHVVYVTDSAMSRTDATEVRRREGEAACTLLGATRHELGISNLTCVVEVAQIERLAGVIATVRPEGILLPWLFDTPAKHRLVSHLLWLANRLGSCDRCEVWGYQVHNVLYPNGYVDVTDVIEDKKRLLKVYSSENETSYRYDHMALGMAAWNSRFLREEVKGDGVAHYVEIFFAVPSNEFFELVERFYFRDLRQIYRGDRKVIESAARVHREITGASLIPKKGLGQ